MAHNKPKMLKGFTFFIVESQNKIIWGHPVVDRLWLTKVLGHIIAKKWVIAISRSQTI